MRLAFLAGRLSHLFPTSSWPDFWRIRKKVTMDEEYDCIVLGTGLKVGFQVGVKNK